MKKPKSGRATNKRGGRPTEAEVAKMTGLGYVTVADGAKMIGRAASSLYNRLSFEKDKGRAIPSADPKLKAVVKTRSGNLWIHAESLRKLYTDPAALATGAS